MWTQTQSAPFLRSALAVAGAVLLALILQWVIAAVYVGLIVAAFGGARSTALAAGPAVPMSYFLTALSCAACALYCLKYQGASRVIVVVHLVAVVIPLQALVAAHFELARPEFAVAVGVAFIAALALAALLPGVRLPPAGRALRVAVPAAALLVTLYVFGSLLERGGLANLSFDLTAVYEVRAEFVEHLAPFMGYLVPWQGYVINPALMLIGLRRRSLLIAALGLGLQALLFGMTGYRAFILIPLLLIGCYLLGQRRQLLSLAIGGVLAVIGLALGLYVWLDEPLIPSLLIDRVIVIPAEIHYWYYDFFGVRGQPVLQLSQSVFSSLTPAHYNAPIPEIIGWQYMGSAASANVGLFGDAFANFGFAGCGIFALLFALLLKTVDAAAGATDPRIAAALLGMPAFQLVNSGLLTTLMTHGMAAALLVLWALGPTLSRARAREVR
jgi:hypothetical protein